MRNGPTDPMPEGGQFATRASWKALPPGRMVPIAYDATFTREQYAMISRGLIPLEMEDKWFIFSEGDSLYFHRSWTGDCVFHVILRASGDRFRVAQATGSTNIAHERGSSHQYAAALLDFLIRGLLLHQSVHFPMPPGAPKSASPGLYQHHVAGTGFPERSTNETSESTLWSRFRRWLRL